MQSLGFRHVLAAIAVAMHIPVAWGVWMWISEGLQAARGRLGAGSERRELAAT